MPLLQKILHKSFLWSAIVFAAIFLEMTPILMRSPLPHPIARFHAEPFDILLMAAREILLIMPAIAAFACAMAWWTRRNKASDARHWSILASTSMIVLSTPFFVTDFTLLHHFTDRTFDFVGVLAFAVVLFLIGITGVATFSRRDPSPARVPARAPAMDALAPIA
jgi:hypothetical protein